MTRGIRSHSLNIKDCNRIVNPYTFRLGFPFSSRFYIVEILFLSLTNDRAFLLALLRIFKFGTRCLFRLFNKYRVKNYRWNHHFDNIPWIFILFFTFYLFFFPPLNSTEVDGQMERQFQKLSSRIKGGRFATRILYAVRNYLRLLEKIKKVIWRRVNPARVIWSEDMFASCRA